MFNLQAEIARLLEKYPDPRREDGIYQFRRKQETKASLPRYGIVVDNKDPNQLGRVRVACDTIAPGAITPWIPVVQIGATKKSGWWLIPEIGTQVLMVFIGQGRSKPVVIGSIFDLKHRPPKHTTAKVKDSKLFQTKNHRMEFIDEEGKEGIIISTAKGKMWFALKNDTGIQLINQLGEIKIKCRKFELNSKDDINLTAKKKVKLQSHGDMKFNAKSIRLNSGGDTKLEGRNVKLNASMGITTEGRQLARDGDKVMGIDVHRTFGAGLLPHPYIGKLAEKLSNNVKINGYNAATKDSISKHICPLHLPLPGTQIVQDHRFREGDVTGATAGTVKINDKPAALIGSTVTTCNDIEARDHSVVLAFGASIPMPVIINPKNMPEWEEERDKQEKKEPAFLVVRWVKSSVKEGEIAELSAVVKDIDDGNVITFQIWGEGQNPASDVALRQIPARVEGGVATAEFVWASREAKTSKFFFTAHSAWCKPEESEMLTVEPKPPEDAEEEQAKDEEYAEKENYPELHSPKWLKEENEISEALLDDEVMLTCDVKNIDEGATVKFRIYEKGESKDDPIGEVTGTVKDSKAEASWKVEYIENYNCKQEIEEQGYTVPDYYFIAEYSGEESEKSKTLDAYDYVYYRFVEEHTSEPLPNLEFTVYQPDGTEISSVTDESGRMATRHRVAIGPVSVEVEGLSVSIEAGRRTADVYLGRLVTEVSGPDTGDVGQTLEYAVEGFNWPLVPVRQQTRNNIRWVVRVDGEDTELDTRGDRLELEIPSEWAGREIIVMPFLNTPIERVSVRTAIAEQGSILPITSAFTQQGTQEGGYWGQFTLGNTAYLMEAAGCTVALVANIAYTYTDGSTSITPGTIAQVANNFEPNGDIRWNNALGDTRVRVRLNANGRLYGSGILFTADRFNDLNNGGEDCYVGIRIRLGGTLGNHWVGVNGLTEVGGVPHYIISATSDNDSVHTALTGRLTWRRDGENILIPVAEAREFRVFRVTE